MAENKKGLLKKAIGTLLGAVVTALIFATNTRAATGERSEGEYLSGAHVWLDISRDPAGG